MGGDENALWFTANESPECASLDDMEVRINARMRLTGPPCGAWRIVPASTMSKIRWHSRKPSNSEKGNEQEFGKTTAAAAAAASKTHKKTKKTAAAKFQEQHRAFWVEERASAEQGFCDGSPCNVTKGTANGQQLRSSSASVLPMVPTHTPHLTSLGVATGSLVPTQWVQFWADRSLDLAFTEPW